MTFHRHNFTDGPVRELVRATAVRAGASFGGGSVVATATRLFGHEGAETVLRSAVDPASTSGTWGQQTVANVVPLFIESLRADSAGADLISRGLMVDLEQAGGIGLPQLTADFSPLVGVAENGAIPVLKQTWTNVPLAPKKVAGLSALTSELVNATGGLAERIISEAITTAAGRGLDAVLLSNSAATSTLPAGILNGTAALTATTGGGQAAAASDIGKIVGAIHTAGGGKNIAFYAAPAQAAALGFYAPKLAFPVIAAPSLTAGTVIGVEVGAFVSGFGAAPRTEISKSATIQADTAPANLIGTAGSPPVVSAPVINAFQSDLRVLKVVLRVDWGLRLPGAAQWITGATW